MIKITNPSTKHFCFSVQYNTVIFKRLCQKSLNAELQAESTYLPKQQSELYAWFSDTFGGSYESDSEAVLSDEFVSSRRSLGSSVERRGTLSLIRA